MCKKIDEMDDALPRIELSHAEYFKENTVNVQNVYNFLYLLHRRNLVDPCLGIWSLQDDAPFDIHH